ncbi:MAG TPA: hypothetical protein VGP08_13530 [Pyrinomonadaceae bacterium]|jgi:hypothetical protein|nr:hypothetical protein [Pyrinomonadaceae bacterium]
MSEPPEIMSEPPEITNPFPGLRPFETDEYRLFFGREGQSDELISRLGRARFLAVVGTSGSGKSSLVRAGFLPALRGGMMAGVGAGWRVALMRPGGDPVGNLARVLAERGVLEEAGGGLAPAEGEAVIEATLRGGSLGLVGAVQQARLAAQDKLLVIVDQFEELFRFRAARAASSTDDAAAFVKLLLEAARQRELNIYVVLTMRSDFLGDCSQFQGLPEAINEGQYLIPRMNRDERRAAIVGPVRVARGRMSEPLVNRLLNDVGDSPDQLPILQHALMRTWDYWAAHRRDGEPIGLEHYEAIGTMAGALSEHADEAFNELQNERSRHIAEVLFKTLTERGADNREIRRPTRLSEVCKIAGASTEEVVAVVEVFRREGRSFLMPPVGAPLTPDTVLDISHESLIRNWERLKEWVEEEAQSARTCRRLAEAAVLNRKGEEGLLQDPGLHLALDWREKSKPNSAWGRRYHPEFDTAIAYLDESRAAHEAELAEVERRKQEELERERRELEQARAFAEQQKRSARRLRWAFAAMAVLFVLSLGTAAYAYRLKQSAEVSQALALQANIMAFAERESAQEAKRNAERFAGQLKDKNEQLEDAQTETEKQAKIASDRADEAEKEKKKALDAQGRAEKSSVAATAAQKSAEQSRTAALAEAARAEANAKKTKAAMRRGQFLREGLEASRRKDAENAYHSFSNLVTSLDAVLDPRLNSTPPEPKVESLLVQLGWALTNLGAVQREMGNLTDAKASYERARETLDNELSEAAQADGPYEPILFETYHGLGHTYQDIALTGYVDKDGTREKIDPKAYFADAEKVFVHALDIQKGRLKRLDGLEPRPPEARDVADDVAAGTLNLARLYRDMGRITEAGNTLTELIKFRNQLGHGDADQVIAARKELAEFYRDQNLFIGAEHAYNELADEQEKVVDKVISEGNTGGEDYAGRGGEIAESYNELAESYRGQETAAKKEKAEDAFAAAMAIQRLSLRLRRQLSASFSPNAVTMADAADAADAVADAYVKLGKPARAFMLYDYAFTVRKDRKLRNQLAKSFDRLTRLYRRPDFYDFAKAEKYNLDLIAEFSGDDPKGTRTPGDDAKVARYVDTLTLCAELYAREPGKLDVARSYYDHAVDIYKARDDWMKQNVILFKIVQTYARLKMVPEWKDAARRRLDLLASEMDKVVSGPGVLPGGYITLVGEYANATQGLAFVHGLDKGDAGADASAAAVYQKAFEASDFVSQKIYNLRALRTYAEMLDNYEALLNKLGKAEEAARVAASARRVRDKSEDIQQQQRAQQTHLSGQPTQWGAPQTLTP